MSVNSGDELTGKSAFAGYLRKGVMGGRRGNFGQRERFLTEWASLHVGPMGEVRGDEGELALTAFPTSISLIFPHPLPVIKVSLTLSAQHAPL